MAKQRLETRTDCEVTEPACPRRERSISRRELINGLAAAAFLFFPFSMTAWATETALNRPRKLSFYNLHTGEKLSVVYWEQGHYDVLALSQIDYIMRDFRAGVVKPIDVRLLDLLYLLRLDLGSERPFELISGYRTPATNAMLRARTQGVSPVSMHMQARAADVRLPDRSAEDLWLAACRRCAGGAGYYPESGFVHIDVGRVRRWVFPPSASRAVAFALPIVGCSDAGQKI